MVLHAGTVPLLVTDDISVHGRQAERLLGDVYSPLDNNIITMLLMDLQPDASWNTCHGHTRCGRHFLGGKVGRHILDQK